VTGEGSGGRLVAPDVAASGAAPGFARPLEEVVAVAAAAPDHPQDSGPGTDLAAGLILYNF